MTHTKPSTAISGFRSFAVCLVLLLLPLLPARACIWQNTHNNYLFKLYDSAPFRDCADDVTRDNWKAYLGKSKDDYFYFNAEEVSAAALAKGDQLMASYVQHLQTYLDCARSVSEEQWHYPTKEELAERERSLLSVRTYAQGKLRTPLRSQHALLFMRCNMLLSRHAENVAFWEQTASQYIETIYKDMMQDIYAGALLHTGRADEAGELFAKLGDYESLMTQYYLRRSCQAIGEEYRRNPDSAVLPFLLQDFVNNAQEAVDAYEEGWGVQGKLFIRDIEKKEAFDMCALADAVVSEGKSSCPLMWQTARAWLEYLFGDRQTARSLIMKTDGMAGNEWMKDCARVIAMYITTATGDNTGRPFDEYVARELQWLDDNSDKHIYYEGAKDRIIHQTLTARYERSGRQATALALLKACGDWCYDVHIDTMSVEHLQQFRDYLHSTTLGTLDRYLARQVNLNDTAFYDLMGTKFMRLRQWGKAQEWLRLVPPAFYAAKGYAPYAAHRSWSVEPWIKRQLLRGDVIYGDTPVTLRLNPKLAFAAEMESLEKGSGGSGNWHQRCYDLAIRYAQASYTGDCWFLMRDGKSVSDTVRANEADLLYYARDYLRQAAQTKDPKLKEKALFAQTYAYLYPEDQWWFEYTWDEGKMARKPQPAMPQYAAFAAFHAFARQTPVSDYVSRCDEYRQFTKRY